MDDLGPPLSASRPPRNRIGWRHRIRRLQGSAVQLDLRAYDPGLARIAELEPSLRRCSDTQLRSHADELRARARAGESLGALRDAMFALVREAARRTLGMRPFDVQIVAALALDSGSVAEMQTGEGKTLVAVMPAALNALTGLGVHVLTFNDYLARRDAEWMQPVYEHLGLAVRYVQQEMSSGARRSAYLADVTYVTAKEAGFDHLRDLLATGPMDLVHRPFHLALVDEADSLMIDEARIPLVIAGRIEGDKAGGAPFAALVRSLVPQVHFDMDEYARNVELTEAGIEEIEHALGCGSLHAESNYALLTDVHCALHAHTLLRRDVDYIVRNGRIEMVDEFTGRVVPDRHWPDGLQAALEAKEGLDPHGQGNILGSMTLQRFLLGYPRLCGMTGTAQAAAAELNRFYGLEVVVIPTNRPMIRVDLPDLVFTHRDAKERALIAEILRVHALGRPVLVGTLTIEESERLALALRDCGIACEVLNAKNDAAEARIIAAAGAPGAVTISTNMAGRGTDIRLGGEDTADHDRVAALGGLYVIGTNRHESRRVDLQLRGRAGRQGDPGESRFFLSLEDDLLVRFGIDGLISTRFAATRQDEPVDHPVVSAEIARVQRIIEGQNFDIRQTLSRYASVVETQQTLVMERRHALVIGQTIPDVWERVPDRRVAFVHAVGEDAVRRAERTLTLHHIDRLWRDHLRLCADLREGIHLVRLGGREPLARFMTETTDAFSGLQDAVDEAVLSSLDTVRITDGALDLSGAGIKAPSATWTYLVNDDPFRNQMGMLLIGPGRATVALYAAAVLMPLLVVWGLVDRFRRKPSAPRRTPFRR